MTESTALEPERLDSAESWGFTSPNGGLQMQSPNQVAAAARELGTIGAMVTAAQSRPRDEFACVQRIAAACQRPALAEESIYDFPRAGERVTGPSATFARFLAAQWGNLRYAIDVIEDSPEKRQVRGWAHDLQTNVMCAYEHTFSKKIQRKSRKTGQATEWILTEDERELREMTARWGGLLVRNALLALIPPDVVDKALATCAQTKRAVAEKALRENRQDATHRMLFEFGKLGVTPELVEGFLGHPLDVLSAEELTTLRGIKTAIDQGQAAREDFFALKSGASIEGQSIVEGLKAKVAAAVETPAEVQRVVEPWITGAQNQAIQAAVVDGKIAEAHVHEYRKRCGLGKGAKMTGAQADEFLAMIHDGRVHTLVDDGIR